MAEDQEDTNEEANVPEESEQQADGDNAESDDEEMTQEEIRESGGQKIMCFVSKEMVPINQTVELEYMPGKKVRVLPKYIKYEREESEV